MHVGTTGAVRLADGQAGPAFEYGRLEVFVNGTWGSVCDRRMFTTSSAQVACMSLGYDGGAPLRFYQPYTNTQAFTEPDENDVRTPPASGLHVMLVLPVVLAWSLLALL